MNHHALPTAILLLSACTIVEEHPISLRPCDPTFGTDGESSGSSSSSAESSDVSSSEDSLSDEGSSDEGSTGDPPTGVPAPTATCPVLDTGSTAPHTVSVCPAGMTSCRNALVVNAHDASGTGPLAIYMHGTYESPTGVLPYDPIDYPPSWGQRHGIRMEIETHNGLLILPYGDPAAAARTNNPFPWWPICGPEGTGCDRTDDYQVVDELVACAVDQGLVDPARLTISGLSAGGIMTSLELAARDYWAAGAVWSGGMPMGAEFEPAGDAPVAVFHGGAGDVYCGVGAVGCYSFRPPSESLAEDQVAAGNFAVICDHQAGHAAAMAQQGAEFLMLGHTIAIPSSGSMVDSLQSYGFSGGTRWMWDNFGCYDAGGVNPWD